MSQFYYDNKLSREHIKYVLGIDLSLNESYTISESTAKLILEQQLLYETFLDTIKDFAKEKYNKAVTTISDWKDAAVILGKVLSNNQTLQNFSDNFWKSFKNNTQQQLIKILDKLGLSDLISKVEKVIDKITSLEGWKKFLAATAIGSIGKLIVNNVKEFGVEKIKNLIINYISDKGITSVLSKLTDIKSYFGWLSPILGTAEAIYDTLKPTIDKFKAAFSFKPNMQTEGDNKPSMDQIKKGVKAEMRHTKDIKDKKQAKKAALKIVLDHLKEDPKYYDKLAKAGLEEEMIKCKNKQCNHSWDTQDSSDHDKYVCHLCGTDNTPIESLNEGEFCPHCLIEYILEHRSVLAEAKYQGRTVQLGKPMAGDTKKFKVYVKNNKGNVVKVNFGQKGVKIKKNNPARRKSFRARHHCDTNPGPRWKARYWSCRKW